MSGRVGSITTGIIADGLVFNMDPANRASTIPSTSTDKTFNTVNTSVSGSFTSTGMYDASNHVTFAFDGSNRINVNTSTISFANDFAISIWVNPSSISGGYRMFWGGSGYSGGNGIGFYMYNNNIRPFVSFNGSASQLFNSNPPLVIGDWFHLILQRAVGNKWEL